MRGKALNSIILLSVLLGSIACNMISIPIKKRPSQKQSQTNENGFLHTIDGEQSVIDPLTNNKQFMYFGDIQVGNSQQTFTVDFDTGSNLTWLTSSKCITCKIDGYKNNFNCNSENGCNLTTTKANIGYGDGAQVYGKIAKVPINFPGLGSVVESLLLVDLSIHNGNLNSDGLFGLGVYNEHNDQSISYVEALYNQGVISNNIFSFYLGFGLSESQLFIGGYDHTKVANNSNINYHPIIINGRKDDSQRWSLGLSSVSLGNIQVQLGNTKNVGIVDSGSSFISIRIDIFQQIFAYLTKNYPVKQYRNSDTYIVTCGTELPDLKFTLKNTQGVDIEYSVPSSFYIVPNGNICVIGISSMGAGSDVQFILGDNFMRRYVSIFSYADKSVGLTLSVATPQSTLHVQEQEHSNILGLVAFGIALAALVGIFIKRLKN